jgi:hypothetical protein
MAISIFFNAAALDAQLELTPPFAQAIESRFGWHAQGEPNHYLVAKPSPLSGILTLRTSN